EATNDAWRSPEWSERSAADLRLWQRLLQVSDGSLGDAGLGEVEELKVRQLLEFLQPLVGDLRLAERELPQPLQAGDVLQASVRHLRAEQAEAFQFLVIAQLLDAHISDLSRQDDRLEGKTLQLLDAGVGDVSAGQVEGAELLQGSQFLE